MSFARPDLAARRRELQRRCAQERDEIGQLGLAIATQLAQFDRGFVSVRRWLTVPRVFAASLAILVLLGSRRSRQLARSAIAIAPLALRFTLRSRWFREILFPARR